MSTFQRYRIPTVHLTAMKLVLLVAVADLAAGTTLVLAHASAPAAAMVSASANQQDASRRGAWHEVQQIVFSSFAMQSRVFDISGAGIIRQDAAAPAAGSLFRLY
jgi:hypothetical protein